MSEEYKIIIVDDHKLFREGLSFVLSQIKGFFVAGEASSGLSFLEMMDCVHADIVLMDISMPGISGITTTEQALIKQPELKVIALTMFCDSEYFNKMLQAGVAGYILKDSGMEELSRALKSVAAGERYYSQKLLHNIILNSSGQRTVNKSVSNHLVKLTQKEKEVLKLICQGYSNSEISNKLSISHRALEEYKSDLICKTGVKDALNLAIYAIRNSLVDL